MLTASIVGIIILAILIFAVYALLQPDAPAERLRDIFIIFVALELLVIGVALVVLLVQLASLINLLQNEISTDLVRHQRDGKHAQRDCAVPGRERR